MGAKSTGTVLAGTGEENHQAENTRLAEELTEVIKFEIPSREDAWNLNRAEKVSVMFLTHTISVLEFAREDLKKRIEKIDGGEEMLDKLLKDGYRLLEEVRRTIPEKQRVSLMHTSSDYEMRMVPKLTPHKDAVVVSKESMRQLVDAAQIKCTDCVEDSEGAKKCALYETLCDIIPLESYGDRVLCPYNMAVWRD